MSFSRRAGGFIVAGLLACLSAHANEQMMERSGCISCHRVDQKLIGPSFKEVADRYRSDTVATQYLVDKIRAGGEGVWGDIPMQPNTTEKVSDGDLQAIVEWILKL
jgi:cytochrome c